MQEVSVFVIRDEKNEWVEDATVRKSRRLFFMLFIDISCLYKLLINISLHKNLGSVWPTIRLVLWIEPQELECWVHSKATLQKFILC